MAQSDADFSAVASEMLGGSTYLPPEGERQVYYDGITFPVKYVGVIGLSEAKNPTAVVHAITRVRNEQKQTGAKKVPMTLVVSTQGLQMVDMNRIVHDTFPLMKVAFATVFASDRKVFAFVSTNDTVSPHIHKCYVLKTSSPGRTAKALEVIGRCFTLATELRRQQGQGGTLDAMPFDRVVQLVRDRLRRNRLTPTDDTFVNAALTQLQRLYSAVAGPSTQMMPLPPPPEDHSGIYAEVSGRASHA